MYKKSQYVAPQSTAKPYINANEPYISAKEPCISTKETYISGKEPYVLCHTCTAACASEPE